LLHFLATRSAGIQRFLVPTAVLGALGLVALFVFSGSRVMFYALLALILLAWLLILVLVVLNPADSPSVHSLLRTFTQQVDRAGQQWRNDPTEHHAAVLRAFDKLHDEMQSLLVQRKIKMRQLKREVLRFDSPEEPVAMRWRPPTLGELGYVLVAAETFSRDGAVLALYQHLGEKQNPDGSWVDVYTIVREGSAGNFSSGFQARIQSPYVHRPAAEPPPAGLDRDNTTA
jgi:hypothetical protein